MAGLTWKPSLLDFFYIPDRDLDERIFVISDMLVTVDILQGLQVVSFQGASEWALDSLVTSEAIWLPREDQLRKILEAALIEMGDLQLKLISLINTCRCEIFTRGEWLSFDASQVDEAYAKALLYIFSKREKEW